MSDAYKARLIEAAESGERLLVAVGNTVYDAHIKACVLDVVHAVARVAGTREDFHEHAWDLATVNDIAPAGLEYVEMEDDGLQARARQLREAAEAGEHLSLAEQLLRQRIEGQ